MITRTKPSRRKSALCLLTASALVLSLLTTVVVPAHVDAADFPDSIQCPKDLKCAVCAKNKSLSDISYAQIHDYDDEPLKDDDGPIIVSLGDSFSSGEGIEPFYGEDASNKTKVTNADWLAHRSEKSWPGQLEFEGLDKDTRYYKETNWYFRAVSGALTYHLFHPQTKEFDRGIVGQHDGTAYLPPQLDVFKELPKNSVDYVTMTMGGNDVNFSKIVTEVVMGSTYLDTSELEKMISNLWKDYFKKDGVRERLYASYKAIAKAAGPQATIIVAGYPRLYDEEGAGWTVSYDEAQMVNDAVSNFNLELEKLVNYCAEQEGMNICFVSVEEAFKNRGAYASGAYINQVYLLWSRDEDLKNFNKASAYSMHPNKTGAEKYADCVNKKIEDLEKAKKEKLEHDALNATAKEREIVLVLDRSGSMMGTPIRETRTAAHKFVEQIVASNANVGVVAYDDYASIYSVTTDKKEYLDNAIDDIDTGGSTNIEDGLKMADSMLSQSTASKKIIVLMSDGEPNVGKEGDSLIKYADQLAAKGYYIYTLGFFSELSYPYNAQQLMEGIASDPCYHYEVTDADVLQYIFGDIASQISGQSYHYIRIACPVDVTVSYNGETMSSKDNYSTVRTSFGSMTFEESEEDDTAYSDSYYDDSYYGGWYSNETYYDDTSDQPSDTRVKILRLKEGVDYDIQIEGNGKGTMNYTIGFMNSDGDYSDMRQFPDIEITPVTKIDTQAKRSNETYMYVDQDGNGSHDLTYRAGENGVAELVDYSWVVWLCVVLAILAALVILVLVLRRHLKIRKYLPTSV